MTLGRVIRVDLTSECDFAQWRVKARRLLQNKIGPPQVAWKAPSSPPSLLDPSYEPWDNLEERPCYLTAPSRFMDIAERVVCHRDPERFARLYEILFRLQLDRHLLDRTTDADMAAWFEPDHYIVELATPFFMRRFPNMDWIIVTPDCTAVWDGAELAFGLGPRSDCRGANPATRDARERGHRTKPLEGHFGQAKKGKLALKFSLHSIHPLQRHAVSARNNYGYDDSDNFFGDWVCCGVYSLWAFTRQGNGTR